MLWQRAAGGVLLAAALVLGIDVLVCRHAAAPRVHARDDDPPPRTATAPPPAPQLAPQPPAPAEPPPPPAIGTDQAQAKLADEALEPVRDAFLADLTAQAKAHDLVVRLGIDRRGTVVLVNADGGCTDRVLRALHDLVDRERANTAGLKQLGCATGPVLDL